MTSQTQPHSGMRPVIAIIGKRNAGKSSLLNRLVGQEISIVSAKLGTTTDAVMKAYELIPAGPVSIYDTAGLDDNGDLGALRVKATKKIIERADVVIYVIGEDGLDGQIENEIRSLHLNGVKVIPVANFADTRKKDKYLSAVVQLYQGVCVSAKTGEGFDALKERLVDVVLSLGQGQAMLKHLISPLDTVVLVTPIDSETPRGRMIMPQIQALREVMDAHAIAVVTQPEELAATLKKMRTTPALVVTDSQAVKKVAEIVPERIPMTTFSVLMARAKWNLAQVSLGVKTVKSLKAGDKILIAEGCSHRVTCHDIGRKLIPSLLEKYTKKKFTYDYVTGNDFAEDISQYKLVIHCGGCMLNQKEIERRLKVCAEHNVAITNYGMLISLTQGVFERVTDSIL